MSGTVQAPLRPLGIGELLDAAIQLYRSRAGELIKAVLVVLVPIQVIASLVALSAGSTQALTTTGNDVRVNGAALGATAVGLVLGLLATLLSTGACFRIVAEAVLGNDVSWRDSLAFAGRRLLPLLWVSVLYGLGVFVVALPTFFLLCLPALWIAVSWVVAYPALLVEDERGAGALRRSFRLVRRRWWATFGTLVVGAILAVVIALIVGAVLGLLSLAGDSFGLRVFTSGVANLVASALTTPFQAAVLTLVYFDLRVRKEGFDLEMLAGQLEGTAGTGAPDPDAGRPESAGQPPSREGEGAHGGWLPPRADTDPR